MANPVAMDSRLLPNTTTSATLRLVLLGNAFLVVGLLALAVDLPVARWMAEHKPGGDLTKLVHLAEVFAHGMGVGAIILSVFVLDRMRRRGVLRLAACAFVPGIIVNLIKITYGRWRPSARLDHESVFDSFVGWFPALTQGKLAEMADHQIQSFPSGHTATAVGLAIGLSYLYPHGRFLFAFFACLAAAQRLASNAHYPSDVLFGAALSCFVGALLGHPAVFGKFFDRFERKTQSDNDWPKIENGTSNARAA